MRRRLRSTSRAMVSSWIGGADVEADVVKDQVFKMHQLAVNPQRGAGDGEMGALDPPRSGTRTGDGLVEARQNRCGVRDRPHEGLERQFGQIITH